MDNVKWWIALIVPLILVFAGFCVSMIETRSQVQEIKTSVDRIEARVFVLATESNCNEE